MRFITWNINGLRSLRNDFKQLFQTFDAQLICFQETKLSRNLIEDWMAFIPNYSSYFSFPKYKTGYSGVVSYCAETVRPFGAEDCLLEWNEIVDKSVEESKLWVISDSKSELQTKSEMKALDSEGRAVITKHLIQINDSLINLFVFNVYCPNAGTDRLEFKLNFLKLLEQKAKQLIENSDNNLVVILGDINISHRRIDHCEPYDEFESDPSRQWLTQLLSINSENPTFIDVFRHLYPDRTEAFTCWNTQAGARSTNYGTRIDLIIADYRLKNYIKDCIILSDILGSDHCPVLIEFTDAVQPIASPRFSKLCTKVWPEFGNSSQSTLIRFLCNKTKNSETDEKTPNNPNIKKLKISAKRVQKRSQTTLSNYFINTKNQKLNNEKSSETSEQNLDNTELGLSGIENGFKTTTDLDLIEDNSCLQNSSSGTSSTSSSGISSTGTSDAINGLSINQNCDSIEKWKSVFKSVPTAPVCSGHSEPCVSRRVNKMGPNYGKQFYVCARPIGHPDNKLSRCQYFKWAKDLLKT